MARGETGTFSEVARGGEGRSITPFYEKGGTSHLPIKFYDRGKPEESVGQDGVPPGPPPVPFHFKRRDSGKNFQNTKQIYFFKLFFFF